MRPTSNRWLRLGALASIGLPLVGLNAAMAQAPKRSPRISRAPTVAPFQPPSLMPNPVPSLPAYPSPSYTPSQTPARTPSAPLARVPGSLPALRPPGGGLSSAPTGLTPPPSGATDAASKPASYAPPTVANPTLATTPNTARQLPLAPGSAPVAPAVAAGGQPPAASYWGPAPPPAPPKRVTLLRRMFNGLAIFMGADEEGLAETPATRDPTTGRTNVLASKPWMQLVK